MVMIRENGKGFKIAEKVLKQKGIKVRKPISKKDKLTRNPPYLQH